MGVAFDPRFRSKNIIISNSCISALNHIRDLRRIRVHLNKATAISLANALVSACLDFVFCSVVPKNLKQVYVMYRFVFPGW